jgi:hypothetical protein
LVFRVQIFFSNQPLFDEYDDDLEVLDPDVDDMTNSNQQIHEGIQSIVHEEPEPVYDSYASEGSVEDEDQPLDSHDDNVVLNNVIQEAYEQVPDAFDKTSDLQMNYALINEAEIIEQQYGFLYQLEMQYHWQDPVALYMEFVFPEVQNFATCGIKENCSCKYGLPIHFLLQKYQFFYIFLFTCKEEDPLGSEIISWLHWKFAYT